MGANRLRLAARKGRSRARRLGSSIIKAAPSKKKGGESGGLLCVSLRGQKKIGPTVLAASSGQGY